MVTLGDMKHPVLKENGLNKAFIIFGTINDFELPEGGWRKTVKNYKTWEKFVENERIKANRMAIEKETRDVSLTNNMHAYIYPDNNIDKGLIILPSAFKHTLITMAKKTIKELSCVNNFISDTVYSKLQKGIHRGWALRK